MTVTGTLKDIKVKVRSKFLISSFYSHLSQNLFHQLWTLLILRFRHRCKDSGTTFYELIKATLYLKAFNIKTYCLLFKWAKIGLVDICSSLIEDFL